MGLRLKGGAIFLHIPKTGGSFVTRVLTDLGLVEGLAGSKHADVFRSLYPNDYASCVKRVVRDFPHRVIGKFTEKKHHDWTAGPRPEQPGEDDLPFMFCFVRHPVSWVESYFRFTKEQGWPYWSSEYDYYGFWHPNAILNDIRSNDFNDFIEKLIAKRPGYVTEMYGWYTQPGVRFIGKTESLKEDLMKVLYELGFEIDYDKIHSRKKENQSNKEPITWNPDLKEEFLRLEYAALRRYGYK